MPRTPAKQIAFAGIIATLAVDQFTKNWLVGLLGSGQVIKVTSFFELVQVWNHGVSFGMFNHGGPQVPGLQQNILALLTVIIVFMLLQWLRRTEAKLPALGLGLIIGGAIGNMIDRFHYGAVADFLYFHIGPHYWPAFNVADSCIVIGVGLLLFDSATASTKARAKDKSVPFASGD